MPKVVEQMWLGIVGYTVLLRQIQVHSFKGQSWDLVAGREGVVALRRDDALAAPLLPGGSRSGFAVAVGGFRD